jgi:hypothetical protein
MQPARVLVLQRVVTAELVVVVHPARDHPPKVVRREVWAARSRALLLLAPQAQAQAQQR